MHLKVVKISSSSESPPRLPRMQLELSNLKDLPELHRMGHTCANSNGEILFFWGGTSDKHRAQSGPADQDQQLWIYETMTGYWRWRRCQGDCPGYLSGATSALIGRKMYLFGGHSSRSDNWLNSLYCLDLETFDWTQLVSTCNDPVEPIRSDKQVSWSYAGTFYIFGGYGWAQTEHRPSIYDRQQGFQLMADQRWTKFGWNNQLVGWDSRRQRWHWPEYSGKCPSARAAHSGALLGDKYYVFGGRDSHERLNDLYTLDMRTFEWNQIAVLMDPTHQMPREPVAHLLELVEELGNEPQVQHLQQEELQQEDEEDDEDFYLNPTPSSTSAFVSEAPQVVTNWSDMDDDEDDDEENKMNPWPNAGSYLKERLSLASNQSQSSSSTAMHLIDGEYPHNLQAAQSDLMEPHQPEEAPVANEAPFILQQVPILPAGRSFASFTPIGEQKILLFGGIDSQGDNLSDCWLLDTERLTWSRADLNLNHPRLWHTGARTCDNQVIIVGGSCSDQIDEFCTDVLSISLGPKSLRRLALDAVAVSIKMRAIAATKQRLPSNIYKLIKLRKRAIVLTKFGRRCHNHRPDRLTGDYL